MTWRASCVRRKTTLVRGIIAVAALGFCASPASAAPSKIKQSTCPQTISQAGDYELAVDIGPCAAGVNGIVITVSNVSLQLKGHRIIGSTNPAVCNSANGIRVGFQTDPVTGVRVFGAGSLENFRVGFWSRNAANSFVKNLNISGTCTNLAFSWGIVLQSSTDWKVDGNVVREPGDTSTGILVQSGSDNNELVRNDVNDTIALFDSSNNTIVNNVGNDDAGGMFLGTAGGPSAGSNNNQIHANTTNNNLHGGYGLWISAGTGNNVTGNTSLGNVGFDLRDDNTSPDANKWRGNTFVTANQTWIQ